MKYLTTKPDVGRKLTLRLNHWFIGKAGTKVTVLRSRKDTLCASGLRIFVSHPKYNTDLDARWFKQYSKEFSFKPPPTTGQQCKKHPASYMPDCPACIRDRKAVGL